MILTLFYFFIALMLLITVHEYGHFLVARLCGVKVLRFSFGFGKVLFRCYDKKGTEYAISALPFGGYVKMLDESEGEVNPEERHLAFNNKSVYARIAIVLAGPLFNFIFAFAVFWLVLVLGIYSLAPIIANITPHSIAEQAGFAAQQEILTVNQQPIHNWHDFQYVLAPKLGTSEIVTVEVKSLIDDQKKIIDLPIKNWQSQSDINGPLTSLGITPLIPTLPPVIGKVMKHSVAARAGFHSNDKIETIDGKPMNDWFAVVEYVQQHPNTKLSIQIQRHHHAKTITVTTSSHKVDGKTVGYLGLHVQKVNWPPHLIRLQKQNPLMAINTAFNQTMNMTVTTFVMFGRLLTGHLGLKHLSGPVGIAKIAGNSGRNGLTSYLTFLGFISISLGALNLLPIPILDGGHFIYYLIELICRRPLPDKIKQLGFYIGFILIFLLMFLAIFNDFSRLLS